MTTVEQLQSPSLASTTLTIAKPLQGFLNIEVDQWTKFFIGKKGANILEVGKVSTADKAGLKAGEVIVKVDNSTIESPLQLKQALRKMHSGDQIKLEVVGRDQKHRTVSVALEISPPFLGIVGEETYRDGISINEVIKGSPASIAGIKKYDLLT